MLFILLGQTSNDSNPSLEEGNYYIDSHLSSIHHKTPIRTRKSLLLIHLNYPRVILIGIFKAYANVKSTKSGVVEKKSMGAK